MSSRSIGITDHPTSSSQVDGDKLVTVVGHQFIALTVYICVQHGGREAPRRADLSAAAETCSHLLVFMCL